MALLPARTGGARLRRTGRAVQQRAGINPLRIPEMQHGTSETIPDPIEFVLSDRYLDRPNLYPRQATILKVIFLRDDMFTQYDHDVIGGWEEAFRKSGNEGISPKIYDRIRICKEQGRPWFRETLAVVGRRGSKGYIGGLAGSYVLWNYMHKPGGPQSYYGIDRDKRLTAIVFAGKKEQATANQWRDLTNVILGGPCFSKYISRAQSERLTVYAPNDLLRAVRSEMLGIQTENDQASFEIIPAPSTTMAGRGPTSFCLDPSTPVLTADLRWVPIADLSEGDEVVGLDEQPEVKGAQRKMRRAVVRRTWRTRKQALRLTFTDGSSVVCSQDHRWLCRDMGTGGASRWRTASSLVVGNHIKSLVDPWDEERTWESGYLAGLLDGEGSVSGWQGRAGRSVFFSQLPGPVLESALQLMRSRGLTPVRSNTGPVEQWSVSGSEAMRLLGSIRPQRLMQKASAVWEGVAPRGGSTASGRVKPDSHKTIESIEELPEQELVDIETSTGTFIANGLVSHNCQFYDEMAHVVASGANRDAEAVYQSATPSLDQFGVDAFIYEPSSPWQMIGQFYENWKKAIELEEDGTPAYPEMLMYQLPSWGPYADWERAEQIPVGPPKKVHIEVEVQIPAPSPLLPATVETRTIEQLQPARTFRPLKRAIQAYDDQMRQLEKANPDTFAVERRSRWAQSLAQYLDKDAVEAIFKPWHGLAVAETARGILAETYKAHGDPSKSGANFGFAIAHRVWDPEKEMYHVVFDVVHSWRPVDFEDNKVNYLEIIEHLKEYVRRFTPDELTFDQWNSVMPIATLQKFVLDEGFPKMISIFEKTATRPHNWKRAEVFKTAINLGLVHAPALDLNGKANEHADLAELELRFLEEKNGAVDHPTSGPVQTKDIADAMMECVYSLIGEQVGAFLGQSFANVGISGAVQGGMDPHRDQRPIGADNQTINSLSQVMGGSARRRGAVARGGPSRGGRRG